MASWYRRGGMNVDYLRAITASLTLALGVGAQPAPSTDRSDPLVEYRVKGDGAKRLLYLDVAWPSGLRPVFPRDDAAIITRPLVSRMGVAPMPLVRIQDDAEWASDCERLGCRLFYTVDVRKGIASDRRGDWGFQEKQGLIMAPLVRWLVRPVDRRARGRVRLTFDGGKNFELVSGALAGRTNHIDADLLMMDGPHVVLGDFTHKRLDFPGGRVDVAIGRGKRGVRDKELVTWIREGAQDVITLLGRLPISRLQVIVAGGGPYAVGSAVTMGMGGASIFVVVGQRAGRADLRRDWVMTHEMLHVAFPDMGFRMRWMEEGLSTYLEPLLRARRMREEPRELWAEFLRAMPQGLPKDGDRGLDGARTWGRRYWGGAMFWLHVDLEIRRRTEGARSLDDVLRAVQSEGGNVAVRWDLARLAQVAEKATATTALRDIYDAWARQAVSPDLSALWASLGVKSDEAGRVSFDDEAPLAGLRRDLTQSAASGPGSR